MRRSRVIAAVGAVSAAAVSAASIAVAPATQARTYLPGWTGGDRLAIHGGSGIGESVSNGCLHARANDLRWLLRRVPLGTQITIHP